MTDEERESVIEEIIDEELQKTRSYCYMWINNKSIKVAIYTRLPNSTVRVWRKSDYDKSLLDGSDEEIAMQILLDFTFSTSDRP